MTNALIGGVVVLTVLVQGHAATGAAQGRADPYSGLFTVEPPEAVRTGEVAIAAIDKAIPARERYRVERGPCNMPIVRGNAAVDPRSIVPVERGTTDHKIRAVEPAVCWEKDK